MPTDTTAKLNLPLIAAAQAQKHVTHNEALEALDTLVQATVLDRDLTAPPATPAEGDSYIVAAAATGDWTGHDGEIASFRNGGWLFHAPRKGWLAHVADENTFVFHDGTQWVELAAAIAALQNLLRLGVNTTADDTNRLAVKSDAVLFSHDDTSGSGSGDMRLKFNKAASANTASLLFQSNWSGRAEIGLTGDDDFRFKVSPDGGTWHESLVIDRNTGWVRFPSGGVREVLRADIVIHVDPVNGDDLNDGLTPATALKNIAEAIQRCYQLDSNGFNVTIQLADGTYPRTFVNRRIVGGAVMNISGNPANPANVVFNSVGWHNLVISDAANVAISHIKLQNSGTGSLMWVSGASIISVDNVVFGACSRDHVEIIQNSILDVAGDYEIVAGARAHLHARTGAIVNYINRTITISGTPHFSTAFAWFRQAALYGDWNTQWNGPATGKRYIVETNAVVDVTNTAPDFFPGDVAGDVASGGYYG